MLVTYDELVDLVKRGVIEGVDPGRINGASIDVCLGQFAWVEDPMGGLVWLARKQGPRLLKHNLMDEPLYLKPGAFALAQTREVFNLPDYIACEFRLKSSGARAGLDQALAVWIDPGFNGSVLTLELRNNLQDHTLVLEYGMPIGQLIFWKGDPVPAEKSYRTIGQYNGDKEAQPSKGVR